MDKSFNNYKIEERSYVAYVKREIHTTISRAHFSLSQAGEIDIIVSEICSNLIKHAGGGELLYRVSELDSDDSVFEIISIDKGPGIADIAKVQKDGVSSTGTLGQGLGAINRLSTVSQIFSRPGWGTVLYSTVRTKQTEKNRKDYTVPITGLCVNKPREKVCGDGFRFKRTASEWMIFFGDGLGHGEKAKEAVDLAGQLFLESKEVDPCLLLKEIHNQVKHTRGMVATIAVLHVPSNEWKICGVGNILTRMYTGLQYKTYMSYNGTVGLVLPNSMKATVLPADKNQQLIMCSDGINSRWDISNFPAIFKYHPAVLAASIYKDFTRGNDDSSIVIAKIT